MKIVVYLDEARQHSFSALPTQVLMLNPGRNVVDSELLESVSNAENGENEFTRAVESGVVTIHGDRVDITKKDVKAALELIELETTVEGVQELLDQENSAKKPRKSVVEAAGAKISSITEALRKAKEDAAKVKEKGNQSGGADESK